MPRCLGILCVASLLSGAVRAQVPQAEYAGRRSTLASQLGDGTFVMRGGEEPVLDYMSFFQLPNFLYLTGYREAGAALVMRKHGADVRWTLFVQEKDPAQEVWSGQRYGPAGAGRATGIPARAAADFEPVVDSLLHAGGRVWVLAAVAESGDTINRDESFLAALRAKHPDIDIADPAGVVLRMRGRKSSAELDLIRRAAAISMEAHHEAARALEPGMNEFEIQALLEYTFRRNGAERPAYASIVGAGPNGATLHYNRDDRFMQSGELLVIDAAAEYAGYTADVTRTFPVSGTFTPDQRALYQVVRDAQSTAERQAKPGARWRDISDSASAVLARGLARLGLIEAPHATYACGEGRHCAQLSLYYMHGLGHGIGLEVHDPDRRGGDGGTVGAGSAFTIEPGLYVRGNLLEIIPDTPANQALRRRIAPALERFANTGVRIEDDYVVTDEGLEWISCVARDVDDVEAMMRERYAGPQPRDSARVDWYRGIGVDPADAGSVQAPMPRSCNLPRM